MEENKYSNVLLLLHPLLYEAVKKQHVSLAQQREVFQQRLEALSALMLAA
jgi:hypothetical protein